jgi:hypothetical protein
MSAYIINVTQEFACSYVVEADSPEQAREHLLNGWGEPFAEQDPGNIVAMDEPVVMDSNS